MKVMKEIVKIEYTPEQMVDLVDYYNNLFMYKNSGFILEKDFDILQATKETTHTRNLIVRKIHFVSYPIRASGNFLRHVFLRYQNIEIHPGMSGETRPTQLVFTTCDYFQTDSRVEGYGFFCTSCLGKTLCDMSRRTRSFHFVYNNCDTMNPVVMQTTIIWLSTICVFVGAIFTATETYNLFTFMMFAPLIAFCLMLIVNRFDSKYGRMNDHVYSCKHIKDIKKHSHVG